MQMGPKYVGRDHFRFPSALLCGLIFFATSIPVAAFQAVEHDSEKIEALSWAARADLAAGHLDKAWDEAQETERLSKEA